MTLLEAAQKALPGLAWEQIGSSEVEYIYAEKNGDGYGVFDLADLDELVTDMTVRRDALDDLLGATPRCVMTDELAALRAQLAAAREALRPVVHQKWCDAMAFRGCDCGAVMRNDEALGNARRALGLEAPNG